MKKLLFLCCFLLGCAPGSKYSQPPVKPFQEGAALAKKMADWKVTPGTTAFHGIYKNAVFELVESFRGKAVEKLFQELARRDPIETLCTPSSLAYELTELQKGLKDYPWDLYFSAVWQNTTHSAYANMARAAALNDAGEALIEICSGNRPPLYYEGKYYCDQALKAAEQVHKGDPCWPYCEMLGKVSKLGKQSAILKEIHDYPQEIVLYLCLSKIFTTIDRADKGRLLNELQSDSPTNYALFFTVHLGKSGSRKVSTDGWEWEPLQKGFEKLLQEHPQALGVRNAYAVAATVFEKKEVMAEQVAKLGYLWDEGYWGSLAEYRRSLSSLPDYHLGQSEFSPPALDPFFQQYTFHGQTRLQARSLLGRELWPALDTYVTSLKVPDQNVEAEQSLEESEVETNGSYQALENTLRSWRQATDSPTSGAVMGGFYINYGWSARGTGTADTVSAEGWTKFKERLKISRDLLYAIFGAGYHSESTMANLMILYNAESANLDSAKKLAVTAARSGRTGNAAIRSYAQMLLPRWHGEPGDMAAAADLLRKKSGNDDCYALMTGVAIDAEGLECLEPGHPVEMDWKRSIDSVVQAGKHQRLSQRTARYFLHYCALRNARQDAAQILPFVPLSFPAIRDYPPVLLTAEREWAAGRIPSITKKSKLTYTLNGPRRQKSGPGLKVGFTLHVDPPDPIGQRYVIHVKCPLTDYEGSRFEEYVLTDALYPMEGKALSCEPQRNALGLLNSGTYVIELREGDGTVLHKETFEVLP